MPPPLVALGFLMALTMAFSFGSMEERPLQARRPDDKTEVFLA